MSKHESSLKRTSPEIEIPVLSTNILSSVGIILNSEGWSNSRTKYLNICKLYLYLTRLNLAILILSLSYVTFSLNHEFSSECSHKLFYLFGTLLVSNELRNPISIAQINESHTSHFTNPLNPTGQSNRFAGIG